jgi:hypothetical protein
MQSCAAAASSLSAVRRRMLRFLRIFILVGLAARKSHNTLLTLDLRRFPTGGDADAAPEAPVAHNPALDQAYIQSLLNRPDRMTWDEYKEKHKEQLSDRLGAGVEREQAEYRKMLDQERNRKVASLLSPSS